MQRDHDAKTMHRTAAAAANSCSADAMDAAAPGAAADILLAQAEERVAELQLALLRAQAECEQVRRRCDAEMANAAKFAVADFAKALLPFKDALEMALAVETDDVSALKTGLELALRQLQAALDSNGVGGKGGEHLSV